MGQQVRYHHSRIPPVAIQAAMLEESRRQPSVPEADAGGDHSASQPIRKLTFSAVKGKKAQTPRKKAAFTPIRIAGDVKSKIEPESPTPAVRTVQAGQADVMEDVKPSLANIGEAMGGMDLVSTPITSIRAPHPNTGITSQTPMQRLLAKVEPSTPLFLPYDSPASFAPARSQSSSPYEDQADHHQSSPPAIEFAGTPAVESPVSGFGLFSDDSPPPKRVSTSPERHQEAQHESVHDVKPVIASPEDGSGTAGFGLFSDDSPPAKREYRSPARFSTPDYESDANRRLSPCSSTSSTGSRGRASSRVDSGSPLVQRPTARQAVPPSTGKTPKRRAFLDFLAQVDKSEDEDEDIGAYDYDLSGSMGSLEDFIVDDEDDVEYVYDDDDLPEDDFESGEGGEEVVSRPRLSVQAEVVHLQDWADSDDDDGSAVDAPALDKDDLLDAIDGLSLGDRSPPISKTNKKGKTIAKKPGNWKVERISIAQNVFDDLDKRVFDGKLGPQGAGAKIVWNKRLLTTAGTAHRKRQRRADGSTTWEVGIQLSEKVCTGEEQILSTVAHEMCHLACWVIDNDFKSAHGPRFKAWGRKVERKRSDLEVTTKHNYIIEYKYKWECVGCRKIYGRHSKSIDIFKNGCGVCKGKLEPMFDTKQRPMNGFQAYLKQNMATAKAAMPGVGHGEVMRALSTRWSEAGAGADHEAHWRTVLTASRA